MSDLQARLDSIRQRVTSEDFLRGRGLGNDVPFYAFDYPPAAEQQVSAHVDWLVNDISRKTELHVENVDLFMLAVEQLRSRGLYDKALSMEASKLSLIHI